MSESSEQPKIHPASIWAVLAIVAGGALVTISYSIDHNRKAKAQWASLFGEGETVKPPYVGKLEDDLAATNRDGSDVRLSEIKGKVWIASYLFSDCPMGCIANAQNLRQIHDEFGADPRFHMVSFSVNSEGDTEDKIAGFMKEQGIDFPNWWYLTAPDDRLDRYTVDFFKLNAPQPVEDEELAAKVGIIAHDLRVVLVDGKANIRGYYDLLNASEVPGREETIGELNLLRLERDLRFILENEMEQPAQ